MADLNRRVQRLEDLANPPPRVRYTVRFAGDSAGPDDDETVTIRLHWPGDGDEEEGE